MSTQTTSVHPLKSLATQVREIVSAQCGYKLRVSESLELVSKSAGYPNWDTACAMYPANSIPGLDDVAQGIARRLIDDHSQHIDGKTLFLLSGAVLSWLAPLASLDPSADAAAPAPIPSIFDSVDAFRHGLVLGAVGSGKDESLAMVAEKHYARGGCVIMLSDRPIHSSDVALFEDRLKGRGEKTHLDFASEVPDVSDIMSGLTQALKRPGLVVIQCPPDHPEGSSVSAAVAAALTEALHFLKAADALLPSYMLFARIDSTAAFQRISLIQREGRKVNLASWISRYLFVDPRHVSQVLGREAQSIIANTHNVIIHGPVSDSAAKALVATSIVADHDQSMVAGMTSAHAYIRTPRSRTIGLRDVTAEVTPTYSKEEVESKFAAYFLDLRDEMQKEGEGVVVDKQTEWENFLRHLIAEGHIPGEASTWRCPSKVVRS